MEKILVCLKQVPNTKDVKINPENHTLIREGVESILNPHDDCALEQALELKRKYGIKVGTMTMGPPQAEEVLAYSLRRGADESFIFTDRRLAGSDTWATAMAVVALIKKIGYDTVFCGQESIDSGTGHIGASISELLNIPLVNYAGSVEEYSEGKLSINAKFDKTDALIEVTTPAVVSFMKKDFDFKLLNEDEIDRSKINKMSLEDLNLDPEHVGLDGSFTQVVNIDIDDRFVGYMIVDSNMTANERILYMTTGGIEENENQRIIRDLDKDSVAEIASLIR